MIYTKEAKETKAQKKEKVQTEDEQSDLLTVHEVARRLRVDDTTVRRWIKTGAMEAITLPHRNQRQAYRIRKSTLDALFNEPATRKQAS
jgi:excisionase family DNA binding protein